MADFATPTDMSNRTQGQIAATTHPFLVDELAAATATIREYCGWHIAETKNVDLIRRFPCREQVWLPAMQITEIVAATVDGVLFDVDRLAKVEFDPVTGWTNIVGRAVKITYTAGYPTVPADLKQMVLEMAAGGLGSPLGITREQAGSVSVTLDRVSGAIAEADFGRLTPYRLGRLP